MSPILGIIASQNYSRVTDTGDMFPISTVTVGSGGAASVTFSSIPSTYTHLQIRITEAYSGSGFNPRVRFNSDTGSNYSWHYVLGDGSSASAGAAANTTGMFLNSNTALSTMTVHIIDILDYANINKNKTIRVLDGYDANGSGFIDLWSGNWRNTSAVTSISIDAGTFAQYSSFALYGIKGA